MAQKIRISNIERIIISEGEWRRLLALGASAQDVKIKGIGEVVVLPPSVTVDEVVAALLAKTDS